MKTVEHLEWRYAVKKFDPARLIPEADLQAMLEVLRLAPSSFGLQPWKFVVVEDKELRRQIQPAAWNQKQVTEASHLIVLCALRSMDEAYVENFIRHSAHTRGAMPETLAGYQKVILKFIRNLSPEGVSEWMKKQVYLALGMLLAECARWKIDTCPMEGFEPEKVDTILDLASQNLQAVVLCPIGYRAVDDPLASLKKVRFQPDQIFIYKK